MRIVVMGGGVSGLCAALILARAGHQIVLIERDPLTLGPAEAAFDWERRGIPHFQQPHAFLPRGRREMRAALPDVYELLLRAGASELDIGRKLRGPRIPEDEELSYLSVRRPVMEWALRSTAAGDHRITLRGGVKVTSLITQRGDVPEIKGVRTDAGEDFAADLVLDALGRNTPVPRWLAEAGATLRSESAKTFIVYYSRYYRMHSGKSFPDGPWLTTPRGDFGYAGFSTFTGDNGTFATVLAIGSWDHEMRILQHASAYEAASAATPALRRLTDPEFAEPITPVFAMGELQNTLRHYVEDGRPRAIGLLPLGDTVCHTDPSFALGLSFSLVHARALVEAIAKHGGDLASLARAYWEAIYPEIRERYDFAAAADAARARVWQGDQLDITRASGCYPLFAMVAASLAALKDDAVLRKTARRIGFLDRTAIFDEDAVLHARIEAIMTEMMATAPGRNGLPQREELLRTTRAAVGANEQAD